MLDTQRIQNITGFGQSELASADAYVYRPTNLEEIVRVLNLARNERRRVVIRGAGRSYGDAALLSESVAIDLTRMNRILSWDPTSGVIECEPGVTIEDIWRHCLEDGWWPPVVSGTMYPTLGGALAMNIHGKNNPKAGTLGEHVLELDLLLADGTVKRLTPNDGLFYAAISGFGVLGIIVRIVLRMKRVESANLRVLAISPASWEEQIEAFEKYEHDADYMVSWIDCFAVGIKSGRGQFHAAWYEHPPQVDTASLLVVNQDLPDNLMGLVPKAVMWKVLRPLNNRPCMKLLNAAKDAAGRTIGNHKTVSQSLVAFSFLLDYVPRWQDAYLPGGFIQYQSFVPKDKAADVFRRQIQAQQAAKLESFLGVMKRHRADKFLFSHGVDGYSLALDFKVTPSNRRRLERLCHEMNDLVLEAGGRFYFAKDSTLRPSDAAAFLGPQTILKLSELKAKLDPESLFSSGLSQRLFRL